MSIPMLSQKPTKFTDVNPGSRIKVTSPNGTFETFETFVLEMRKEYGPNRVPALVHKRVGSEGGSEILIADGTSRIDILLDSKILQREAPPEGALVVRTVPREYTAARFDGGAPSAMAIIAFSGGLANIRWEQATDQSTEALVLSRLEQEDRIEIGDFVLVGASTVLIVKGDQLAADYELVEIAPGGNFGGN